MYPPDLILILRVTIIAGLISWTGKVAMAAFCHFNGWR